jgi:hypothetical protein
MPAASSVSTLLIPVAPGELIDKITILEIKVAHIADPDKRANVTHELELLRKVLAQAVLPQDDLTRLTIKLKGINETLWGIEDDIRDCEAAQNFGHRFIDLARAVYRTNDKRAAIKREINLLLESDIMEEKSYHSYESGS